VLSVWASAVQNVYAVSRVLVVEDHAYLGNLLEEILPEAGFEVRMVGTVRAAVSELGAFHPDVILTDFRLPGEDGLDLCRAVRDDPEFRGIPIVLHTAADPRGSRISEALALPEVTILAKPAGLDTMIDHLREVAHP
jgi:CheY-like chemotaxis protein